jgi:predicted RNA-binding protein with PIN domain
MTDNDLHLIVVDAANVIGSRPDGWWRDRAGAARRLLTSLAAYQQHPDTHATITVILEGAARAAANSPTAANAPTAGTSPDQISADEQPTDQKATDQPYGDLGIVLASGSGDDTIVDVVRAAADEHRGRPITVVTADRALRARVEGLGATTTGPRWLLDRLN